MICQKIKLDAVNFIYINKNWILKKNRDDGNYCIFNINTSFSYNLGDYLTKTFENFNNIFSACELFINNNSLNLPVYNTLDKNYLIINIIDDIIYLTEIFTEFNNILISKKDNIQFNYTKKKWESVEYNVNEAKVLFHIKKLSVQKNELILEDSLKLDQSTCIINHSFLHILFPNNSTMMFLFNSGSNGKIEKYPEELKYSLVFDVENFKFKNFICDKNCSIYSEHVINKTIYDYWKFYQILAFNLLDNKSIIYNINTNETLEFDGKLTFYYNFFENDYEYSLSSDEGITILKFNKKNKLIFDVELINNKIYLTAFKEFDKYLCIYEHDGTNDIKNINAMYEIIKDALDNTNDELTLSYTQDDNYISMKIDIDNRYFCNTLLEFTLKKQILDKFELLEQKVEYLMNQ